MSESMFHWQVEWKLTTPTCDLLIAVHYDTTLLYTPRNTVHTIKTTSNKIYASCEEFVPFCRKSFSGWQYLFLDSKKAKTDPLLSVFDADWIFGTHGSLTSVHLSGRWCLESWYAYQQVSILANRHAVLMTAAGRSAPCLPTHGQIALPAHTQPA